ncbi:hypothetical protein BIW11_04027 [Tropilaelaps mercedesae]|uniref:Uncharacterized protein n=1 Tax=Tropilaelaps mercedesae TaxID=418985 RepID=A0A1V9XC77_9ACAR|nr:hypothetical protein BIW11_04027 [Tropilaelaps mercedesae]
MFVILGWKAREGADRTTKATIKFLIDTYNLFALLCTQYTEVNDLADCSASTTINIRFRGTLPGNFTGDRSSSSLSAAQTKHARSPTRLADVLESNCAAIATVRIYVVSDEHGEPTADGSGKMDRVAASPSKISVAVTTHGSRPGEPFYFVPSSGKTVLYEW